MINFLACLSFIQKLIKLIAVPRARSESPSFKRLRQDLHRALAEALTQVVEMDTAGCAVHAPSAGETVEAGK